jgi:hypothetical protein
MNERIEKLAEQAKAHVLARIDEDDSDWDDQHTVLYNQKFAELIAAECVRIIDNKKDQAIDEEWKVDEAMSAASFDIEDHFGIIE